VLDYHCPAAKGEPSRVEQFGGASLSIVCSGVFGFRSDQHTQLLTTDFLLLGNPGQQYEISHEHAGGDRCLIFHLDEAMLAEIADTRRRRRTRRYFARSVLPPLPRVTALRHLVEQRLGAGTASLELEELAVASASYVMTQVGAGDLRSPRTPAGSRRTREAMYRALEWLERSIAEDVHLADIARLAELSPYHFLRVFKHEIGVTPYRFLVRARIRRAVAMLTHSDVPITTIAYDVGFGDLSNFVHTFRREVGCSPWW
jgi:AraC family transcriptional regulator